MLEKQGRVTLRKVIGKTKGGKCRHTTIGDEFEKFVIKQIESKDLT